MKDTPHFESRTELDVNEFLRANQYESTFQELNPRYRFKSWCEWRLNAGWDSLILATLKECGYELSYLENNRRVVL